MLANSPSQCASTRSASLVWRQWPVSKAHFLLANTRYIAGTLNTWGWVMLCVGVLEWAVGRGLFVKNQFSRWTGVVVLTLNSIAQLMMMPAYPFWSLSIYGGRSRDLWANRMRRAHQRRLI